MKLKINLGDELKNAKIIYAKNTSVTKHFETPIAFGEIKFEHNDYIIEFEKINIPNFKKIKNLYECGVRGFVLERKDNLITKFKIDSVSIQYK